MNNFISKPDSELIHLVRSSGSNEAFLEVCRRYENIFYSVCQKYVTPLFNIGVSLQDIFEEKNCIILHCISTYEPTKKTKLGTWIGNYARYLCLNSINARRFIIPTTDEELKKHLEESQVCRDFFAAASTTIEDFEYVLNILEQVKDKRIIQIFKLRYLSQKKMIWAEIAKEVGSSTQTIINLHNKGLELLKKKLRSESVSDVI